jgi:hypothetical protein
VFPVSVSARWRISLQDLAYCLSLAVENLSGSGIVRPVFIVEVREAVRAA